MAGVLDQAVANANTQASLANTYANAYYGTQRPLLEKAIHNTNLWGATYADMAMPAAAGTLAAGNTYSNAATGSGMAAYNAMAQDALNYDSAGMQDKLAGEAGAQTRSSIGAARAANQRQLASMGVNPNSGRFQTDSSAADGAATAQAMTLARDSAKQLGWNKLAAVSSAGQQYGALGNATTQLGSTLGTSAMNASQQGLNNQLALGSADQSALGTANSLLGTSSTTGLSIYDSTMRAQHAADAANAANTLGWANVAGTAGNWLANNTDKVGNAASAVGDTLSGWWDMISDERCKEDKRALDGIDALDVEQWRYKPGVADEGTHIGPYAQDVQREFGDEAAPGGVRLNSQAMNHYADDAIRELLRKVDQLETSIGKRGRG